MTFKEIIGHQRAVRFIQKAISSDHLPHSYLFLGPSGVGKKLTALILAKALNCQAGKGDCCDICLSCRKIEDGNHPDVMVIGPEGQFIKIDQIRQLQRSLNYRPYEGKKRVCILDAADQMKAEGANALLKTLEEPPADTLLILLAKDRNLLLPTILSRCQQVKFTPLPDREIARELAKRLSLGAQEAGTLAGLSQGSLGQALEMFQHEMWSKRNEIIQEIMDLSVTNTDHVFATAASFEALGENLPLVFPIMISWYRDLVVWNEHADSLRLVNQDLQEEIRARASTMSRKSLLRRIELIGETSRALNRNANRLLALETLMLQLR